MKYYPHQIRTFEFYHDGRHYLAYQRLSEYQQYYYYTSFRNSSGMKINFVGIRWKEPGRLFILIEDYYSTRSPDFDTMGFLDSATDAFKTKVYSAFFWEQMEI